MIKEIKRRIMMLANLARVVYQNDADNVQKMQVETPLDVRPDTLRFAEFGFTSALPKGTDVIVLAIGGDRSSQVAIASNHNGFRLTGLNSGEVAIYNQWGQYIKLTEKEIEVYAKGKDVIVKEAAKVEVTATSVEINSPKTTINGNLIVSGATTTSGLNVNAGSGGGRSTFAGDIEHVSGTITSLGNRIDGRHKHPITQGSEFVGEPQ